MSPILIKKEYLYQWPRDKMRQAHIYFNVGSEITFDKCIYEGVNKIYTLDDWDFLRDLATEIQNLGGR